ncbi:MAG: hypothetical protein CSA31_01755 [Desulfobulbus propionicus]|nr:MAG: hypothetical protein CSA31_01755 [Desulfobulbus propionicus]
MLFGPKKRDVLKGIVKNEKFCPGPGCTKKMIAGTAQVIYRMFCGVLKRIMPGPGKKATMHDKMPLRCDPLRYRL